ncbi:MAG: type II toxin-antitoxin system VapB family antitoxin [Sulfuricurvum sp.]
MISVAKIFTSGNSQAVRLPKEFRFENQEEVFIKKIENGVMLLSKSDKSVWDTLFSKLDDFSDDFMQKREQPKQNREDLF